MPNVLMGHSKRWFIKLNEIQTEIGLCGLILSMWGNIFIPAPESVVMIVSFTEKSWDTLQNVKNHDLLMELVVVVQKIYGMDGWMKVLCFMSLFREQSGTVD